VRIPSTATKSPGAKVSMKRPVTWRTKASGCQARKKKQASEKLLTLLVPTLIEGGSHSRVKRPVASSHAAFFSLRE